MPGGRSVRQKLKGAVGHSLREGRLKSIGTASFYNNVELNAAPHYPRQLYNIPDAICELPRCGEIDRLWILVYSKTIARGICENGQGTSHRLERDFWAREARHKCGDRFLI